MHVVAQQVLQRRACKWALAVTTKMETALVMSVALTVVLIPTLRDSQGLVSLAQVFAALMGTSQNRERSEPSPDTDSSGEYYRESRGSGRTPPRTQ